MNVPDSHTLFWKTARTTAGEFWLAFIKWPVVILVILFWYHCEQLWQINNNNNNKFDFHRLLAATWWSQQTYFNLLTTSIKLVKSTTCSKSVVFLVVYSTSIFWKTFWIFHSLPFSYEIMKKCWKVEPKERPTFIEIHQLLYDMLIDNEVSKR